MKNERSNLTLIGTNGEWKGSSNSSCREPFGYVNQHNTSVELPTTQDKLSVRRETVHVDYRVGCGGLRANWRPPPSLRRMVPVRDAAGAL